MARQSTVSPTYLAQDTIQSQPRRHLLDVDDLSTSEISDLLDTAEGMLEITARDVRKTPALRGKTIITMFFEDSSRTRVSFEQAGKILGADVINITASASSVSKGESLLNTVKDIYDVQNLIQQYAVFSDSSEFLSTNGCNGITDYASIVIC